MRLANLTTGRLQKAYQQIMLPVHSIAPGRRLNKCMT